MEAYKPLKYLLNTFDIKSKGKLNIKILVAFVLSCYMLIQSIIAGILHRRNKQLIFLAVEDVIMNEYTFWMLLELLLFPKNVVDTVELIGKKYYKYKAGITKRKTEVLTECGKAGNKILLIFSSVQILNFTLIYIPPLILTVFKVLTKLPGERIDYNQSFASESWLPFQIDSFLVYLIIYLHNLLFYILSLPNCLSSMGSTVAVLHRITTDVRLLNVSIREIDHIFLRSESSLDQLESKGDTSSEMDHYEQLCQYFKDLVAHQSQIYRELVLINNTLAMRAFNIDKTSVFLTCIGLICLFEADETAIKIKYLVVMFIVVTVTFLYTAIGQSVENESENLRNALYECRWVEMPLKFKKVVLLMMTRATRDMQMKPKGMFAWNFEIFSSTMNAGYAYCQFLRTANKT